MTAYTHKEKAPLSEMEVPLVQKTAHSCKGGANGVPSVNQDLSTVQPKCSHALCTLLVHPPPPHVPPFLLRLHPIINEVSILTPRKKLRCQKWRSHVQAQKTAHSCQRREKWPNKGFLQPSQEVAILFSCFGCTHPVPHFCWSRTYVARTLAEMTLQTQNLNFN